MKTVSVLIPSYNSRTTLEPLIQALAESDIPDVREVIIADSSDDGLTGPWLKALTHPKIRLIDLPKKTMPALARNRAAQSASGDILAFVDSDAYPDKDWLPRIQKAVEEGCRAGGGAVLLPPFQVKRPIAWAQYYLQFSDFLPFGSRREVSFTPSCNLFCERALFEAVGGFPEIRASEDVLFAQRIRTKTSFFFDPSIRVFHIFRENLESYDRNQELLGEYVLRYRRQGRSGSFFGSAGAWILLAPGLVYKMARISLRVFQTMRAQYLLGYLKGLPLLLRGVVYWARGYSRAIGRP